MVALIICRDLSGRVRAAGHLAVSGVLDGDGDTVGRPRAPALFDIVPYCLLTFSGVSPGPLRADNNNESRGPTTMNPEAAFDWSSHPHSRGRGVGLFDARRRAESAGAVVVGPVSTVKAALDLLGEEAIDCAVLDVKLEDGISVPVAEALAALGIRFVIATGSDTVPASTTALRSFIKSSLPEEVDRKDGGHPEAVDRPLELSWLHGRRRKGSRRLTLLRQFGFHPLASSR
jgi:hypothetical protein